VLQVAAQLDAAGYMEVGLDPRPLSWLAPAGSPWIAGTLGGGAWAVPPTGTDVIGLGIGAMSRIGDCVVESLADADAWAAAIDAGLLPVWRGCVLHTEERLRIDIIEEWLRRGEIPIDAIERRYGIEFAGHFSTALQRLSGYAADGLASIDSRAVRATSQGRLLLRIMAECFDHHPPRP
jgi:oxygen-independent coproporphyrinogen-3 oxidase